LSQQFSLRFNDSQSLPATPRDMLATWKRFAAIVWRPQILCPMKVGLPRNNGSPNGATGGGLGVSKPVTNRKMKISGTSSTAPNYYSAQ